MLYGDPPKAQWLNIIMDLSWLKNLCPFRRQSAKLPDRILAAELGSRTSKAVHIERRDGALVLCGYALIESPPGEELNSAEGLQKHLNALLEGLRTETKHLALTVRAKEAVLRAVETPMLSAEEFRSVVKLNSKQYLQQELPGYTFDGHVLCYFADRKETAPGSSKSGKNKQRTLVAAARQNLVDTLLEGSKKAGFVLHQVIPSPVAPVNALESAMPEVFSADSLAVVDVGFKSSYISILNRGEFAFSRVVALGGDGLTQKLCEDLNVSYPEAESIKIGMGAEVQAQLEAAVTPLGRELKASMDYFEHQSDVTVNRVFVCGGTSQSPVIREILQNQLMVPCEMWDASAGLRKGLAPDQTAELENVVPNLTVAVGAALAAM